MTPSKMLGVGQVGNLSYIFVPGWCAPAPVSPLKIGESQNLLENSRGAEQLLRSPLLSIASLAQMSIAFSIRPACGIICPYDRYVHCL